MRRISRFNAIRRLDLSILPIPLRFPSVNQDYNISGISTTAKIWRNTHKICKISEIKDYQIIPFKKSARRSSDPDSNPIGKDCRDLNFNSKGNSGIRNILKILDKFELPRGIS